MIEAMETEAVETARAKINLTLRVHGRRADGYHELESLVAFADIGDQVTVHVAADGAQRFQVTGPFAGAIAGDNLVETALRLVSEQAGQPLPADVLLEKVLPVASGIGGGSADAAALLRAVRRCFPEIEARVDWMAIARKLGADVPVCLMSQPALMTGAGERLVPVSLPRLDIVLANPLAAVPADKTRRVFAALAAGPAGAIEARPPPQLADLAAVLSYVKAVGNDLENAALSVLPAMGEVKRTVATSRDCRHALLSGAGPTIVGLYETAAAATRAASDIAAAHRGWWVRASSIAGSSATT